MSGTRRRNGVKAEVTAMIARNEQIDANRALKTTQDRGLVA